MEIFRRPAVADPSAQLGGLGVVVTEMPLKKIPGGKHWHLRHRDESGTLEVTWAQGEVWAEVRANRHGPWVEAAAEELLRLLSY